MLSEDQRRRFARDGYLRIEAGVGAGLVADAREEVWDAVPEDPEDAESLVGVGSRTPDVPAPEPFATINERLHEHAAELVGDDLLAPDGPGMQLALRYPRALRLDEYHDRRPDAGHLDGYGPGFRETGEYSPFTVAVVVYLDDVAERGGGFTVWPGSHWVAADYFEDHALAAPGYGGVLPAIDDDGGWDRDRPLHHQLRSRELSGDAGTVVLWHNQLVHAAGVNQSDAVRMAGIKRFSREGVEGTVEAAATDPFAFWDGVPDLDGD